MGNQRKVCVTGGSGYIGSSLVKKLLEKGYIVHATSRNLEDKSKVDLLKSLPNAENNLVLFEADIYNDNDFEAAIEGCEFVFHVASPWIHDPKSSKYNNTTEATVGGAKSIAEACIKSGIVKRLVYTGSVVAASPWNDDGKSFKSSVDESCWTPLHLPNFLATEHSMKYMKAKRFAEQELLKYNEMEGCELEVVSLVCGLVGGDTVLSSVPVSVAASISQITGNLIGYTYGLMFLQQVLGSVPMVHIDDVCEAHIFCIQNPATRGRFLCSAANPMTMDIANYFTENYPMLKIDDKFKGKPGENIKFSSSKLRKMGFVYKHDMKKILDDSFKCMKRLIRS